MLSFKKRTIILFSLFSVSFVTVWAAKIIVNQTSEPYLSETVSELPFTRAAIVLGCSHRLADGRENTFFRNRIEKASELYHSRRVQHLIVSGDNSRVDYNEPREMKAALIALGVPTDRITCDYAGFSTLDSVVRAKEVFGQNQIIVVSQAFHNKRAIFLARSKGIEAYGLNARDVDRANSFKTLIREELARVKSVIDIWILDREPKFLGPKISL